MAIIDFLNRLLGDPNTRELQRIQPLVAKVRAEQHSTKIQTLQLADLPGKTQELKDRLRSGTALDALLPEAFAVAIRACELLKGTTATIGVQTFVWDMVPFDTQILGGITLHNGAIAEMKTGEGKTLVCTLPAYLNALTGNGVHIVTVNDYLARRDSEWMGVLFKALGLSVGVIVHGLRHEERKAAYACDITYGTNNEFGFDYLRDNMALSVHEQVQRTLNFAIVDEVDSILIDEARTPLIISQPAEESTLKYQTYAKYVQQLQEHEHFLRDEKQRAATLTEKGIEVMEKLLGVENVYTEKGFTEVHHIEQALRALAIYKRDVDYVVRNGEIIIVDEFTGRLMPGRRYSHGLHQAIEAKEVVTVQRESRTLATITFQNYFRLFKKLAGMTGTAKTEEEEFRSIYKLNTIVIPTNKPMMRIDRSDAIYRSVQAKFKAVAKIAKEKYEKGQPVLIGTTSIEKSEAMSLLLQEMQVPHAVLNAKQHEKEAEIIAKAGQKGAVMIATNMAGRGTDIKISEEVSALGGLAILGTERHESRRIDNQLRGRSGRQGDPGESQFFVSVEDDLMRLFGGDKIKSLMDRMNFPEDLPLENGIVSKSIESAQKRVEGRNFDIRRHVVQYDDIMNKHRDIMYKRRQKLLERMMAPEDESCGPLHEECKNLIRSEIHSFVQQSIPDDDPEHWNMEGLKENLGSLHPELVKICSEPRIKQSRSVEELLKNIEVIALAFYEAKIQSYTPTIVRRAEEILSLQAIDVHWMEHIDAMAHLKEQVAFSGFAQRDPLIEYQDQGFQRFKALLITIQNSTVRALFQAEFQQFSLQKKSEGLALDRLQTNEDEILATLDDTGLDQEKKIMGNKKSSSPITSTTTGRNDPCPCGSGKKFKKCHGSI